MRGVQPRPQDVPYAGLGMVWPHTGLATAPDVSDPYGPRPFAAHTPPYDFHRGVDVPVAAGAPVYSPISGAVSRSHYSHFHWERSESLAEFTEEDANGLIAPSVDTGDTELDLAWTSNAGVSGTGFADSSKLICGEAVSPDAEDCDVQIELAAVPSDLTAAQAAVGIFLYDPTTGEHAAIEHNGTGVTCLSADSGGAGSSNGQTGGNTDRWLRLFYDNSAGNLLHQQSADGETWTTIQTWASPSWTSGGPDLAVFRFGIYFRKTTTSAVAASGTIPVNFLGCVYPDTIGRFGNWLQVVNANMGLRTLLMHMSHVSVRSGFVRAGQLLGYAGTSGYDTNSGRILAPHIHMEVIRDTDFLYGNDLPVNPLGVGLLPRANVSNNVSVTRTAGELDPYGSNTCHKLAISVTRQDQDFDVNQITLTGNLATRTINFDTRAGMNPADSDDPTHDGVYVEPVAFDESSNSWDVNVYFDNAVVGGTFVSYAVLDTAGTTLASE